MSIISFNSITKNYKTGFRKKKTALKDFSLDIHEGEVFGFLGPNGAGKCSAIKIYLKIFYQFSTDPVYLLNNLPRNF